MKFHELTLLRDKLVKSAGVLGLAAKTVAAPVNMASKGLWNASKRAGGPFAPLIFGGTVLGGAALAGKSMQQTKNYNQGFNPQLQESLVRS